MTGANFLFFNYVFLLTYAYIEVFFSFLYGSIFKHTKFYTILFSKKINYYVFKNQIFSFVMNLNIFYLITLKLDYVNSSILSLIFLYLIITKLIANFINSNIHFISFNVSILLMFFLFIKTIVAFFLLIELYSIIFYFFYLNSIPQNKSITLLQFKNMLILYLINNFIITLFFLIGLNSIIESFGTVNFLELSYLNGVSYNWTTYFLILSVFCKLALPGFHFLKLEVYKYLTVDVVIIFSVITIFINYFLVLFLFNFNFMFNLLNTFKIVTLLLILSFFYLFIN